MTKKDGPLESLKVTKKAAVPESPKGTEEHARLESLKMTKEWSVWLIALQGSICTFLWSVLKGQLDILQKALHSPQSLPEEFKHVPLANLRFQVALMHFGWLFFAASVLAAIILVSRLPSLIKQIPFENADKRRPSTQTLMTMEYAFFLLGFMCIFIFVLGRFLVAVFEAPMVLD